MLRLSLSVAKQFARFHPSKSLRREVEALEQTPVTGAIILFDPTTNRATREDDVPVFRKRKVVGDAEEPKPFRQRRV